MRVKNYVAATALTIGAMIASEASAYNMTIANRTGKDIYVDVSGIAVIGGSMFNGKKGLDKTPEITVAGMTTKVKYANSLDGPQLIKKDMSTEFQFLNVQVGVCFNLKNFMAATSNVGIAEIEIKTMDPKYWSTVTGAIEKFGSSVEEVGGAVAAAATAAGQAEIAAGAEAGGKSINALLGGITALVASSSCKNMSILLVEGDSQYGVLLGLTNDIDYGE